MDAAAGLEAVDREQQRAVPGDPGAAQDARAHARVRAVPGCPGLSGFDPISPSMSSPRRPPAVPAAAPASGRRAS